LTLSFVPEYKARFSFLPDDSAQEYNWRSCNHPTRAGLSRKRKNKKYRNHVRQVTSQEVFSSDSLSSNTSSKMFRDRENGKREI
jgi:hypothetical protein